MSLGDGEVYVWDVRTRKCLHRFQDEGSIGSTTISCSNNGQFTAVGYVKAIFQIIFLGGQFFCCK